MATKFQAGDVVVSKVAIVDRNEYGWHYLHALPGTRGVVLESDEYTWPNVSWGPEGHGVCNVRDDEIELYTGPVVQVG